MTTVDRRGFLAGGAGLLGTVGLQAISTRMAQAAPGTGARDPNQGYGPLRPTAAVNSRERWLALPEGFEYSIFGTTGSTMTDGQPAPRSSDGMGAFPGPTGATGTTTLIRNQEIRFNNAPGPFTQGTFVIEATADAYDRTAGGGTTTLRFDPTKFRTPSGGLTEHFVSLTGTVVNCAGGVALRGSGWLTCEEIVQNAATAGAPAGSEPRTEQRHGYVFLTPLTAAPGKPAASRPFTAMGRFSHEAAAVDERTGTVYLTEDAGSGRGSGFYRFLPTDPADLAKGGVLQILGLLNRPSADLREGQTPGDPLAVRWITVEDPDPAEELPNAVFEAGFEAGAAKFNRLEGCWEGAGSIFFASTSGGDEKNGDENADGFEEGYGQIWEYVPGRARDRGQLVLLYESPDGDALDSPDNIVVSPRGGLVICEDDSSTANLGQRDTSRFFGEDKNRLIGLTLDGTTFPLAENVLSDSELAGACWSEDGRFLFVNMFGFDEEGTGGTMAITGPWERGAL